MQWGVIALVAVLLVYAGASWLVRRRNMVREGFSGGDGGAGGGSGGGDSSGGRGGGW